MARQIIKQPDGRYAIWSTIVDDFVYVNCTKEEVVDAWISDSNKNIKKELIQDINMLDKGGKPYYQFTKTWDEALEWIKIVHGKRAVNKLLKELKTIE